MVFIKESAHARKTRGREQEEAGSVLLEEVPGTLIIRTHDLSHTLGDAGITVIGGFHSAVERERLNVLLNGMQPLLISPAHSLEDIRVPAAWRAPILQGRLPLLPPVKKKHGRATADLAQKRQFR